MAFQLIEKVINRKREILEDLASNILVFPKVYEGLQVGHVVHYLSSPLIVHFS